VSSGAKVRLHVARAWAEQIKETLAPYCQRIEVGGSIRRRRDLVGDIDFIGEAADSAAFRARAKKNGRVKREGDRVLAVELANGAGLDFWFARPAEKTLFEETAGDWGIRLLVSTGSLTHNVALCQRATAMGLQFKPFEGIFDKATRIASETEADVYEALGMPFLVPTSRSGRVVRQYALPGGTFLSMPAGLKHD